MRLNHGFANLVTIVAIDTFDHAKWCVAHEDLREGRDLENEKDLVW